MTRTDTQVVIAGAGCAGLAAGIALQKRGFSVTILESENRVGGLAGGIQLGKNTYEYGPHIFHTTDPEIMADVQRIAGSVLMVFDKTIKIKFLGKYFDFPLSIPDILLKLPIRTVLSAVFSFLKYNTLGLIEGRAALINSEKVLQRYYGDVLYRIFFKDYIDKVWGMPPSQMAASFAEQRVPRLDILGLIARAKQALFGKKVQAVSTDHYVEKVEGDNYTTERGFAAIAECFADEFKKLGGTLRLNSKVTRLKIENNQCTEVHYSASDGACQSQCNHFISTIPLSVLPQLMENPPQRLVQSASHLKFRGITFVGLLIAKKHVLPASFMYFRDKSFNRITDLGQFLVKIDPDHATIVIAEITCQPADPFWKDENLIKKTVIRELCEEKLIQPEEVIESHIFRTEFGYPIYSVGYEKALSDYFNELSKFSNIYSIGRQGRFAYINTHIAMKMGYELARKIAGH